MAPFHLPVRTVNVDDEVAHERFRPGSNRPDLVVMAASAGGLAALSTVLGSLPADFPAAVLVVQHLDPHYKSLLGQILSRRTALTVTIAVDGAAVRPGQVIVATPDRHLLLEPDGTVSLSSADAVHFVRPSADRLFESAAASFGDRVIGVVLTGTGSDGDHGVQAVKRAGGIVIAQDQNTSQFFGMPGTAIGTGAVDMVLPLDQIAGALVALVQGDGT
jgi:two-component system, chemotaxis family, protein-glutamate methylesterase/glutaminase